MMTVSGMAGGAAASYFELAENEGKGKDGKGPDEYYSQGGTSPGTWHGEGARALGLSGTVEGKQFRQLAAGYRPDGSPAVQNAGAEDRRAGWDLTLSAPKSVSVAMAVANENDREAIIQAHRQAVETAMNYIEREAAFTRRGHAGAVQEKAGLVISRFEHQTSREGDPQLHSHSFVHNLAVRADGTTGTLESKHFYVNQKTAGALYRAELAHQLRERGFDVAREGESFRMTAISREAEQEFSTRRQQIEAEMARAGVSGSRAAEIANLATRQAKDKDATPEKLQAEWRERAAAHGITAETISAARATHAVEGKTPSSGERVMQVATENTAVARVQDLAYCAAVIAQEGGGAREAERLMAEARSAAIELKKEVTFEVETEHGTKVKTVEKVGYTTPEIQQAERAVAEWAERNSDKGTHSVSTPEAIRRIEQSQGYQLNAEQRHAVETLTRSGSAAAMVGDAGTGKSTTLNAVREAYEQAGYRVVGVAPSAKAAAELEKSAGIQSETIDRFNLRHSGAESESKTESGAEMMKRSGPELDTKTVVVVDEAGMADARQIQKLTEAVERAGGKVVMVGDHKQLQPVGAGAPFRAVVERVETARLQEIHRQRDSGDRQAVRDLSQGKAAEVLGHYLARGQVTVAQTHAKAMQQIAARTVEAIDQHGAQGAVALASTNKAVSDINQVVRARLKARGELQDGREYRCLRDAGKDKWDRTEKRHHEKVEFAHGDRVIYSGKNDRREALNRSDTGTVVSVSERAVTIKLDKDGSLREIHPERQDIRHAYALTTHKAQGMTVEKCVVYLQGQNLSREMTYVQASRAKGETDFVTSRAQVEKLARDAPPSRETATMVLAVEQARLDRGQAPALRPEHTATAAGAVEYLQQHAPGAVSNRGKTAAVRDLATLAEAAKGMAESRQSESSLDWQESPSPSGQSGPEPQPGPQPHEAKHDQGREHVQVVEYEGEGPEPDGPDI